jgi:7-carboxy-7-deazaguanine synthase
MSGRDRTLRVVEMFGPTVQGEGAMIGMPTYFLRLGGCEYRCTWCDSFHAVLPSYRKGWARMAPDEVADALAAMRGPAGPYKSWLTISGGNPALQDLRPLLDALQREGGWHVAMETQGTVAPAWLGKLQHLCLSPKPPSAGNVTTWEELALALDAGPAYTAVKVVVFDEHDYEYARYMLERAHAHGCRHLYISAGTPPMDATEDVAVVRRRVLDAFAPLALRVAAELPAVRVLPQLHVLAWGMAPRV